METVQQNGRFTLFCSKYSLFSLSVRQQYLSDPFNKNEQKFTTKRENNYQTKYLFLICSFRCSIFVIVQLGGRSAPRIHDVIHLNNFIIKGTVVGITSNPLNKDILD